MFLAIREIRRAKVRFALLIAAIALLVFLILFQQSLQGGLVTSFVGAIRNQSAPVLVYSVDGQRVIQASVTSPDAEAQIRGVDGVAEAGRFSQSTFSVMADGTIVQASVIGYDVADLGAPAALTQGRQANGVGEAVASDADADIGFGIGDVITILPGNYPITIVGLAADAQLSAAPALFATYDTYLDAVRSRNPDAGDPLPNVIALRPADGVAAQELADRVNAVSDQFDALTRSTAAAETPGVSQVQTSFTLIFLLYGLVVPCVTGLFFLIATFQKAGALTLLRAIGAPARRLVSGLVLQALMILIAGLSVGTLLYFPVSQQRLGSIPLQFETRAVITWWIVLLVLGIASSLVAAQRVLKIDPIQATTGAGVQK